jgi:hypothetical protein
MAYLAYGAISNWQDGNHQQASQTRDYIAEHNKKPEASLYRLLDDLLSYDQANSFSVAQYFSGEDIKHSFINRIRLLQRINQPDNADPISDEQLDQLCAVDRAFTRFRNIEMKQLFLQCCELAHRNSGRTVPQQITATKEQLQQAIAAFTPEARSQIRQQTGAILRQLQESGLVDATEAG